MSIPTYAYAHNNPLKYIDRTGLLGTDYSGVTRWSEVQSYRNGQAMAVKQASGAGWEGAGLLMEDGSGPTIRIVDSSDLEPGQWAATQVNVVDGVVVVGDILLSRDVLGGDANLVAHILVHEVGHWKFWNSKVGQSMSSDLWGKYLNAAGERSFCNQKSSNLPHEGYSAERSVFGELRLSR